MLEKLVSDLQPHSLGEISRKLSLTASGSHRLLDTLAALGYVEKGPERGQYRATMKTWSLGAAVLANVDLRATAMQHLRWLSESTQECVRLVILDKGEIICLEALACTLPRRVEMPGSGGRISARSTAAGVLLTGAHRGRHPPRHDRVVIDDERWLTGVRGLAAAVFDMSGEPVAALDLHAPADRLRGAVLAGARKSLDAAAKAISADLGYAG